MSRLTSTSGFDQLGGISHPYPVSKSCMYHLHELNYYMFQMKLGGGEFKTQFDRLAITSVS